MPRKYMTKQQIEDYEQLCRERIKGMELLPKIQNDQRTGKGELQWP